MAVPKDIISYKRIIVEVLKDNWRNTYVLYQLKRFFYKVFSNPFQKLFNIGTNFGI